VIDNLERDSAPEYQDVVPFIDLRRQYNQYKYEIKLAINRVLASGDYTSGPETEGFEREFAAINSVKHCVGVSSGIKAVEIGLRSLEVKGGDGVITVANAGMHSTSAIRNIGAIPQFADVDPITMTMSPEGLEKAITPITRAVVVTHLYGRVANLKALSAVTKKHDLPLVEDCFQANGAFLDGKPVGTWGDIGCFCFSPTKNLDTLGEAGAIFTRDRKIAASARELRQSGFYFASNPHEILGTSSLMNEIQAAVLRAKLPMLEEWNLRRRMIAQTYKIHLGNSSSIINYDFQSNGSVFQHFVIRTSKRNQVRDYLSRKGIGSAIHYPVPDHLQTAGLNSSYPRIRLPETEKACAEVLSLPCYPELTSREIEQVCTTIDESLRNN
jgi:dTDP-4-amino-4,6-dideoxygalactose transaminase